MSPSSQSTTSLPSPTILRTGLLCPKTTARTNGSRNRNFGQLSPVILSTSFCCYLKERQYLGLKIFVVLLGFLLSSRNTDMVTAALYDPYHEPFSQIFPPFPTNVHEDFEGLSLKPLTDWRKRSQIIAVTAAYVVATALAQFPRKRKEKKRK